MKKNFLVITFIFSSAMIFGANQFVLASDFSNRDSTKQKSNHYFTLSPSLAWNSYKDEINSPLTYHTTGLLLALELGLENRGVNHNGYTNIFFTDQNMTTSQAPYTNAAPEQFLTFKFNTSRCYQLASFWNDRIHTCNRIHYRIGYNGNFEYNHQINLRLENSAYTFAIWASAAVANRFEFPFTIKTEKKFAFIHFRNP
ncbi:MAG TPA: hypothetical protein VE978_20820 [Chitinophagales bacterium]|nr:hypothetical protein [Chitinophagales bacterium]